MNKTCTTKFPLSVSVLIIASVICGIASAEIREGEANGIGNTEAMACEMAKNNAEEVVRKTGIEQIEYLGDCACRINADGQLHYCAIKWQTPANN